MEIFYRGNLPIIHVKWNVYKEDSSVREDFFNARVWAFLTLNGDSTYIAPSVSNDIITYDLPSDMVAGTYGLKIIWVKEDVPAKRAVRDIREALAVSNTEAEATRTEETTLEITSKDVSYGYDGISAYEKAVMQGRTTLSEIEWMAAQNNVPDAVEDMKVLLQAQMSSLRDEVNARVQTYDGQIADAQNAAEQAATASASAGVFANQAQQTLAAHEAFVRSVTEDGEVAQQALEQIATLADLAKKVKVDLSDQATISLARPSQAIVILSGRNETTGADTGTVVIPNSKTDSAGNKIITPAYFTYFDENGNYFKKPCTLRLQGDTSTLFEVKNTSIDLEVNNNGFKIRYGNWLPAHTFHIKAHYTDITKVRCYVGYDLAKQVEETNGAYADKLWKKACYPTTADMDAQIQDVIVNDSTTTLDRMDVGAACMPDAFPVEVYNGTYSDQNYYGLFMFAQNKFRKNYHQKSSVSSGHIHIDGNTSPQQGFFVPTDQMTWKFEIRTPDGLYNEDGTAYDGDDPKKIRTCTTRTAIERLNDTMLSVYDYHVAGNTTALKALMEKRFDIANLIDYILVRLAIRDTDGFYKNGQWLTWNGNTDLAKWYIAQYDMDCSLGTNWHGMFPTEPTFSGVPAPERKEPFYFVLKYYTQQLIDRWNFLKSKGIFTKENILSLIKKRMDEIGYDRYERYYNKYASCPVNRSTQVSPNWNGKVSIVSKWDENVRYAKNDPVMYNNEYYVAIKGDFASENNTGHTPTEGEWWDKSFSQSYDATKTYYSLSDIFDDVTQADNSHKVTVKTNVSANRHYILYNSSARYPMYNANGTFVKVYSTLDSAKEGLANYCEVHTEAYISPQEGIYLRYKCSVSRTVNVSPKVTVSTYYPQVLGFKDSVQRLVRWITLYIEGDGTFHYDEAQQKYVYNKYVGLDNYINHSIQV